MKKIAILIMFLVCISASTTKLFAFNMYLQEACYVEHNKEYENYKTASKDSTIVIGRLIYNARKKGNKHLISKAIAMFYDKKDSEIVLNGEYSDSENSHIAGCYTKEDGVFEIKLPYGEYFVNFSFIGVEDQYRGIILNTKNVDLGDIILKPYSCNFDDEIKVTRIKRRDRKK